MMAAKKKAQEPGLEERLAAIHSELQAFIDAKAAELKAGPCGDGVPIGVLRGLITRNEGCLCKAFMNAEGYGK